MLSCMLGLQSRCSGDCVVTGHWWNAGIRYGNGETTEVSDMSMVLRVANISCMISLHWLLLYFVNLFVYVNDFVYFGCWVYQLWCYCGGYVYCQCHDLLFIYVPALINW